MADQLRFTFTVDDSQVQLVGQEAQRMGIITRQDGCLALVIEVSHGWIAYELDQRQVDDLLVLLLRRGSQTEQ